MANMERYLNQLITDKTALANNLVEKGVEASAEETFTELVPKVLDIPTGATPPTKGIIINKCNSNGYPTDVSVVGMTELPAHFFDHAAYSYTPGGGWLGSVGANLHLPDTLTKIGQEAFTYCMRLGLKSLPDSVSYIAKEAFYYCYELALTKLPDNLTYIGSQAFEYCEKLDIKSVPSGVTIIYDNTFRMCEKLTELTFDGMITQIRQYAFQGSALAKLVIPNVTSVPTLSTTNAFSSTPIASGTGYIYVPDTLLSDFQSASNWSTYASQIKPISELPTE